MSENRSAKLDVFTLEIELRIFLTIESGVGMTCLGIESFAKPHLVSVRPMSRMT